MWGLTCVGVGVEGESAVLEVKEEGVDVQPALANHSDRAVVVDLAIRIDMYIRHKWCVLRNAVGKKNHISHFFRAMFTSLDMRSVLLLLFYIKVISLLRFDWLEE